jgi:hypothetical protein
VSKPDTITIPITIDTTPLRNLGEVLATLGRDLIRIADTLDTPRHDTHTGDTTDP